MRPRRFCAFPGCEVRCAGRGLCAKHYKRLQRHGDPAVVKLVIHPGGPDERFLAKVDEAGPVPPLHPELGPCHVWTGARSSPLPYGTFHAGGRMLYAHQYALLRVGIEIPQGMEPDHLCEVHYCVRREHLEVVTHAENMRRRFERERERTLGFAASLEWRR